VAGEVPGRKGGKKKDEMIVSLCPEQQARTIHDM
jgi:hypothetical protein